jgi:hypothetical protein
VTQPEWRQPEATEPFYRSSLRPADRTPAAFAPRLTAEHPVAHCFCTWVWCPSIGGKDKPFAMKYWNRSCPKLHFKASV